MDRKNTEFGYAFWPADHSKFRIKNHNVDKLIYFLEVAGEQISSLNGTGVAKQNSSFS
jgi:hypothetical protein